MRFISDDGKKVGTQEEVQKYEAELAKKLEATKRKQEILSKKWDNIQTLVNEINKTAEEYFKESGESLYVSVTDGKLKIDKDKRRNINSFNIPFTFF